MSEPQLTVACFLWNRAGGVYGPAQVHALQRMVAAHLSIPHRFVCFADDAAGLECEVLPLWPDGYPRSAIARGSCSERLRLFDPRAAGFIPTPWVLSIDLDCVILRSLDPLISWDDLRICAGPKQPYNASLFLHRIGSRPELWLEYPKHRKPPRVVRSDDAWIAAKGRKVKTWGRPEGVRLIRKQERASPIPRDARILFFPGPHKPWDSEELHRSYRAAYMRWLGKQ